VSPLAAAASPTVLALAGAEAVLEPGGALYLVEERLLAVADMHLEKGSAFARRGQMLPPYDTADTLARLAALVARYRPRTLLALGDSLHDRWAAERLAAGAVEAIRLIGHGREVIWIAGNHDPAPHGLGGMCCDSLALGGLAFRHEPSRTPGAEMAEGTVCGHLHPVARIARAGRGVRRRCFVTDGRRMVLPAFGAFTGGLNVRDPAIAGLFPGRGTSVHLLGEGRTYHLTPAACLGD